MFRQLPDSDSSVYAESALLSIDLLPLNHLLAACEREVVRFRATGESDTRYGLELFQRALERHADGSYAEEEARSALVRQYSSFLGAIFSSAGWLAPDDLIQQAWMRFWQAANRGLVFSSLEAALAYLKQIALSVLSEQRRRDRRYSAEDPLYLVDSTTDDHGISVHHDELFEAYLGQRFYERCHEILPDPLAYRVFTMRFILGQPPREIAQQFALEGVLVKGFPATPRSVSLLLDAISRRLRADPEIRDLLSAD